MKKSSISYKIENTIKKEACSSGFKKVLVALSGGPDSVVAAFILKKIGMEVKALHCNFHLRCQESDRDAEFVSTFCKKNDIELVIRDFDTKSYQEKNKGESIEMACRNLRYEWFRSELNLNNYDRIATGHHADDNIETFFLNLLRGSGTRGLKGMSRDSGFVWRPLLSYHREELMEYITENKLPFVVDSTNKLNDFRRNFLRNKIIPLFKSEWKGFNAAIDRTIENIEAENHLVESFLNNRLSISDGFLKVENILSTPAPLLLIKRYIEPVGPYVKTPYEILDSIRANKPCVKKWNLRNGTIILRNNRLSIEMGHGKSCS